MVHANSELNGSAVAKWPRLPVPEHALGHTPGKEKAPAPHGGAGASIFIPDESLFA